MRISQSFRIGPIRLGVSAPLGRRGRVRLFGSVPDGIGRLGVSAPVGRPKRKRAAR
jgi:hypothetical protein